MKKIIQPGPFGLYVAPLSDLIYMTSMSNFDELLQKASENDKHAMVQLAIAYKSGVLPDPDHGQYFRWIKKAAEAGIEPSFFLLAVAYGNGTGTAADEEQYVIWMKKSAAVGNSEAALLVASAYLQGKGTEPDYEKYYEWMQKSAMAGNPDAAVLNYINNTLKEVGIETIEMVKLFYHLFTTIHFIKASHSEFTDTASVAHFTDYSTLENMLPVDGGNGRIKTNSHLRLYNVEYLNDPHEGCRIFQRIKESEKFADIYQTLFKMENNGEESSISILHEDLSVYVCSFTFYSDRLDLWRAYGRDGDGVCIVTPLEAFDDQSDFHAIGEYLKVGLHGLNTDHNVEDSTESNEMPPTSQRVPRVIYKIKYEDSEVEQTIEKLHPLLQAIASVSKLVNDSQKNALKQCVIATMSDILYLYKNPEYKTEAEARLVFAANINHPMIELDDHSPAKLFVKTDDFLFSANGSKVIIGPKIKNKKMVELNLKYRLNKHGLISTKVENSKVPYR